MAQVGNGQGRTYASDRSTITSTSSVATLTALPAEASVAVQIAASALSATITFEVTVDGSNWASIELMPTTDLTDTALTATASAAGIWVGKLPVACSGFRARCSAFTSQTAAFVTARAAWV